MVFKHSKNETKKPTNNEEASRKEIEKNKPHLRSKGQKVASAERAQNDVCLKKTFVSAI